MQALALAFLATTTTVGGLAWVFLYPALSGERKAEHRRAAVAKSEPAARQADKTQRSRREQVEGSLKDLEARRQKEKKIPLSSRLTQAGLTLTVKKFMMISGVLAAVSFAIAMLAGGGLLAAVGLAFAAGFGLPRWGLSYLKTRREKAFLKAVPEANFFGIVIAIQQKSGGNLSEALGNLSKVLRDRKKMAEKIQAMSMEAKASAGIIGSLPPIVMLHLG